MSIASKFGSQFGKPAMVGVLAYLGSMAMLPHSSVNLFGFSMDNNLYYGLLGVGGSFVSAVNAAIFALGTKQFISAGFGQPVDIMKPALLGAGAEIGGKYVY